MFKIVLIAAVISIASPALISAQDIFWSFSPTTVENSATFSIDPCDPSAAEDPLQVRNGSAYIFSDGLFGFDALKLSITTSESDVIKFTGGEAFNPTLNTLGGQRFNRAALTNNSKGSAAELTLVNVTERGVSPVFSPSLDPGFDAGVGPNGAVMLARLDFEIVGVNFDSSNTDFEFTLGHHGALLLPSTLLNPSLGSASVFGIPPHLSTCTLVGDVNLDYSVDFLDITPFVSMLQPNEFQIEADCNQDGAVDFLDIAPFIGFLSGRFKALTKRF